MENDHRMNILECRRYVALSHKLLMARFLANTCDTHSTPLFHISCYNREKHMLLKCKLKLML